MLVVKAILLWNYLMVTVLGEPWLRRKRNYLLEEGV